MTNKTIDRKTLQALYAQSACARAAFDNFAGRDNKSSRTTVETLQNALRSQGPFSRPEIASLFKELESAGCGQYVIGRKGHPSRFEWSVSLIKVGRAAAATGEGQDEDFLEEEGFEDVGGDEEVEPSSDLIEHRFHLRREFELVVVLPANLTKAEAHRIARFVKVLPFGGDEEGDDRSSE